MADPTYAELLERLDALEQRVLGVQDLPLGGLSRWLETRWSGDLGAIVLPGTIGTEQLAETYLQAVVAGRKVAVGSDTLSFAASATSSAKTVAHGLGVEPQIVLLTCNISSDYIVINTVDGSFDDTNFQCAGRTNAAGAITATPTFYWLAIG